MFVIVLEDYSSIALLEADLLASHDFFEKWSTTTFWNSSSPLHLHFQNTKVSVANLLIPFPDPKSLVVCTEVWITILDTITETILFDAIPLHLLPGEVQELRDDVGTKR